MTGLQRAEVMLPRQYQEYFRRYCQGSTGQRGHIGERPFPRMVDMWFLAICLAVDEKLARVEVTGKVYKAIDGAALESDRWLGRALMLLAVAESDDDVSVIQRPREVVRIANEYAHAGLPRLIGVLEEAGQDLAIDHLSDYLDERIRRSVPEAE